MSLTLVLCSFYLRISSFIGVCFCISVLVVPPDRDVDQRLSDIHTLSPAHCVLCIFLIDTVLPPAHPVLDSYKMTLMTYCSV